MKTLILLLALLAGSRLLAQEIHHTQESLADVRKAVESGKAVLVDVRDKIEWKSGHLKGAIFLPLGDLMSLEKAPENLPRDKPVYVHCAAGIRALKGAKKLKELGLDARALKQGYTELHENGFVSEK